MIMKTALNVLQLIALVLAIILMTALLLYGIRAQQAITRLQHSVQDSTVITPAGVPGCSSIPADSREGTDCDPTR